MLLLYQYIASLCPNDNKMQFYKLNAEVAGFLFQVSNRDFLQNSFD